MPPTYTYQIGGSLQLDSPTYVSRKADLDLYDGLKAGEFCYVLNSRQMGKSSLRVRAMARLQAGGVACVAIQMTDIIEEAMTAEQWYAGVIDSIVSDLGLDFDDYAWWEQYSHLSLVNRFSKFVDEVLLRLVPGPLVIFIDEIDRILSLPFKVNGFFAVIRECYNKRADVPKYQRLSFALLGVATPSDLIEDKRSTPFNVGRAIALTGFTYEEAQPLVPGLAAAVTQPHEVLREILHWTGGQPFLTQKICYLVARREAMTVNDPKAWVERLVRDQVISNWESNDEPEHLRTIRDRLLRDEQTAARRISLYQQILQEDGLPVDVTNPAHIELRLSGAVVERNRQLRVYNPIYAAIFNLDWAAQMLANLRPYSIAISAWLSADRLDKSRLLRGEALREAKQWSEGKVLPPEDYAFLAASQELVTEETEKARQTLALANQTLEEANQEATARIDSANRRLRIGSGILVGTIALSAFLGLYTTQRIGQARDEIDEAQAESREAKQESDLAEQQLDEANKAQAQSQEETEQAQLKVAEAEEKSEEIAQASQRQTRAARQEIEQAAVETARSQEQAQAAQQAQRLAREKADEAAQLAEQAQQDAKVAQQAEEEAKAKQAIVQEGTELERQGIALLRRPSEEFRDIETLLDGLDLGGSLQALMQRDTKAYPGVGIDEYPAISPMLALRATVKSVLETAAFDGEFSSFSDDGQRLVTYSGSDSRTRLYDLSGNEIAAFDGVFRSFSDDGQRLVTYSYSDSRTRLYDLSGNEIAAFDGEFRSFSDDGQRLIIYSPKDKLSHFYDLAGQLVGPESVKGSFKEFSPDQKYFVTTALSEDISLVYDAAGRLLAEYPGSVFGQGDLGFTPDRTRLATKTNDGFYHIWQLDDGLGDLLARGCDWVRPYLQANPEEERAAFCR